VCPERLKCICSSTRLRDKGGDPLAGVEQKAYSWHIPGGDLRDGVPDGFAALTARIGVATMARLPGWPLGRGDMRWRSDHPGRSGWWRRAGHPLPEMPKTTVRARSGGGPARSFGDADALGPPPSPPAAGWEGGAAGGDFGCSMTNRVFIIPSKASMCTL